MIDCKKHAALPHFTHELRASCFLSTFLAFAAAMTMAASDMLGAGEWPGIAARAVAVSQIVVYGKINMQGSSSSKVGQS